MDVTFWVIQAVLLAPVLFMAATAGMEDRPRRLRPSEALPPAATGRNQTQSLRARRADRVAVAVGGLSQFSVEQQAQLVLLRRFVHEARMGHGALADDMIAADDTPAATSGPAPRSAPPWLRRPSNHQLLLAGGVLLMVVGLGGILRTSIAMDQLQPTGPSSAVSLSPVTRFVPGLLANPAKYLSALNGGGGSTASAASDQLYAVGLMQQKQAMDRWEAILGIGLSLLLFLDATAAASVSDSRADADDSSVAFDVAPFVSVAAVLFAALSFFELP